MSAMPYSIELRHISKTFVERSWRSVFFGRLPNKTQALKDITLNVEKGEIFGILGPNGAGKTTLMKIIATLIIPDSGVGRILGCDLIRDSQRVRRMVGLVTMSERSFYWRLTGRQNLNFFAVLYNLTGREKRQRIQYLLKFVGLEDKADSEVMKYSSGQKQRLALARALLSDADILLMDEPTQHLDPLAAAAFVRMAVDVLNGKEGKTIIWSTHNLKEAEEVCTRIAILHKGSLIASGNLHHMRSLIMTGGAYEFIIDRCPEMSLKSIGISPSRIIHSNGNLNFELQVTSDEVPFLVRRMVENGINIRSCRATTVDLEDVFEKVINRVQ